MKRVQCLRMKDMINDYLDGTLDNDDCKELFNHIEHCEDCQAYFEDMKAISDCLAEDLLEELPDGFEESLRMKLQAVAVEHNSYTTLDNVSEFKTTTSKQTQGFNASSYKRYMPALSAAAVVVLAFGVTLSGTGDLKGLGIAGVGQYGAPSISYDAEISKQSPPTARMKLGAAPESEAPTTASVDAPAAASDGAPTEATAKMASAPEGSSVAGAADPASFTDVKQGQQAQQGHKIIQSGSITLETTQMDQSTKQIQDITLKNGGFIESANVGNGPPVYEPSGEIKIGTENLKTAWYHLRIPTENFEQVMTEIATVGKETNRSVSSQDITTQYVDNESQLKNLKTREESLRGLMAKTGNIKDLLEVDRELTSVRSQIDSLASQKKAWDGQISLSGIDVNVNEVKNYSGELTKTPEGVEGILKKALVDSVNTLMAVVIKVFYMVVLLLPYVILFALVYAGVNKWVVHKTPKALNSTTETTEKNVSALESTTEISNLQNEEEQKNEKDAQ